ncbi:MAG: hypothetical protein KIT84_30740 [Labilithrix sp.]|nr:hypothetical protein [Labilithrix sp.]MCW5815445.1 hypothetical protein [Labilithrix sp.]
MADDALLSRDELVAQVAKAHHGASYAEASATGKALAACSKLPRVVAENVGAGFGQWDFFPEATEIVDFALAYVPPADEAAAMAMARTWAADDAGGKRTMLALIGRDVLKHEARRLGLTTLVELCEETRATRANELRRSLGLEAAAVAKPKPGPDAPAKPARKRERAAPKAEFQVPARMPKPAFVPPKKAAPPPPARRFSHPKFGEGVLERTEGNGDDAKHTVKFASGTKTLLARFLTEIATTSESAASQEQG